MATYNHPGVYVEEISTLPPSVAQVATAIPAFIGITEKAPTDQKPVRISNMLEYEQHFGGPLSSEYTLTATKPETADKYIFSGAELTNNNSAKYVMYYALRLYFSNGGGPCWVHSVATFGKTNPTPVKKNYIDGIDTINTLDEPTILVLPDAVLNLDAANYYPLCGTLLDKCGAKKDRFAIMDVQRKSTPASGIMADYYVADEANANTKEGFRSLVGSNYLSYGAAYLPYLKTAIAMQYQDSGVTVKGTKTTQPDTTTYSVELNGGLKVTYKGDENSPKVTVKVNKTAEGIDFADSNSTLTITIRGKGNDDPQGAKVSEVISAWQEKSPKLEGWTLESIAPENSDPLITAISPPKDLKSNLTPEGNTLDKVKGTDMALYSQAKKYLASLPGITLPPSAAMAGLYCQVDRDRGVWKAPANVSVSNVIGPEHYISDEEQGRLNIDPTGGKSINAIRSFTGRGTVVWGSRTLEGNSNEWRYVPVRRLFITVEESVQKATTFAVFEPNNINTWLKVKAMIESYLYGLWQQGAMMGASPEEAYFVHVGLGKTMTQDDVLEGRLIVNIGIAAVRPAEFIILRFQHYVQQS